MRKVAQRGFALIEAVLIIGVLCLIAFVAWRVIEATGTVETTQNSQNTTVNAGDSVPKANTTNDLDELETSLNDATIDDGSEASLDTESTF